MDKTGNKLSFSHTYQTFDLINGRDLVLGQTQHADVFILEKMLKFVTFEEVLSKFNTLQCWDFGEVSKRLETGHVELNGFKVGKLLKECFVILSDSLNCSIVQR